jgi:hypothetical protein
MKNKLMLYCFVVLLMVTSVLSQTPGNQVRTPNVASGGSGPHSWLYPANIETFGDTSSAYAKNYTGNESPSLIGQGFGFSIPSGATVTGVKLEIARWVVPPPEYLGSTVKDATVYLLNSNGNRTGSNKAVLSTGQEQTQSWFMAELVTSGVRAP